MANFIIGGIVLILIIAAIRSIIKNKGTCDCGNGGCNCCQHHCHGKK